MDRKTSRKVCWTASSASASLRRLRLAILKRLDAWRSNRTVKASAFPLCKSLASASSDRNLCRSSPMRAIPPGTASTTASETHVSGKSADLGGTAPNTSLAIRELTLNQPSYMLMHARNPVFPTITIFFAGRNLQAEHRLMASSFHSIPAPALSDGIAIPFSIRSGSETIMFHQSAYSSQWAVGVTLKSCALISGQR